jgi:hypothetical protein
MQTSTQPNKGNGKKQPLVSKKDLVEVTIIATYLVQMLGKPTLDEVKDAARDKLFAKIHHATLKRALEAAQKRTFVAINQAEGEDGQIRKVFSMKNLQWKQPPEYAHIGNLLPKLLSTDAAQEIKDALDAEHNKGGGKSTKRNVIGDYYAYRVKAVLTDGVIGSQIHCPQTREARQQLGIKEPETVVTGPNAPEKKKDDSTPAMEGIFVVDELTGDYIIPPDVMQGWVSTNITRLTELGEARAGYVAFAPVRIRPKRAPVQIVLPVNNKRQGAAAPKAYEYIRAGEQIEINFMAPVRGMLSPEQWEKAFILAGLQPLRGISPARGRRYGRFMVTSFECLGKVSDSGLDFLAQSVPGKLMEEHGAYLKDALSRLKGVNLEGKFTGSNGSNGDDSDD